VVYAVAVPEIVLTLMGRRDCHLCDEMKAVVAEVAAAERVRVETRDVDEDEDLRRAYGDQVPVLLVNGRRAFKYRVEPGELRRRIAVETRRGRARWWRRWGRAPR
jgi:Glutaredoxin-like domain (DUF836)